MRSAGREAIDSAETEVKKIDRDLDRLVDSLKRESPRPAGQGLSQ